MHSMLILIVSAFYIWGIRQAGIEADNEIQYSLFPDRLIVRTSKDQIHLTHKHMNVIYCVCSFSLCYNVLARFDNVFREPHI